MGAAAWAADMFVINLLLHLLLGPCVHGAFHLNAVFIVKILNQFVCAEPLLTLLTVHQGIGETAQVSAGHPCLGIHQDCTVNPHIVWAFHYKLLPPCLFYIVLQFHAKIAVVPGIGKAAVDFRAGIDGVSTVPESLRLHPSLT